MYIKLNDSNCDKTKKNSNCDKTQIKFWQNSRNQFVTKTQKYKLEQKLNNFYVNINESQIGKNSNSPIVTKLKNSSRKKKLKIQVVTKLKNLNGEKIEKK